MATRTHVKSKNSPDVARPPVSAKVFGRIDLIGNEAAAPSLFTWHIESQNCSIGSSEQSSVRIDGLQPHHASIVFGRRNTLVKCYQGSMTVANRTVREWLIDQPTTIAFGQVQIVVYPTAFVRQYVTDAVTEATLEVESAKSEDSVDTAAAMEVAVAAGEPDTNPIQNSSPALPSQATLPTQEIQELLVSSTIQALSQSLAPLQSALENLSTKWEAFAAPSSQPITTQTQIIEQRFEQLERQIPALSAEVEQLNSRVIHALESSDSSMHAMAREMQSQFEAIAQKFSESTQSRDAAVENSLALLTEQLALLQDRLTAPADNYYADHQQLQSYEQLGVQGGRQLTPETLYDASVQEQGDADLRGSITDSAVYQPSRQTTDYHPYASLPSMVDESEDSPSDHEARSELMPLPEADECYNAADDYQEQSIGYSQSYFDDVELEQTLVQSTDAADDAQLSVLDDQSRDWPNAQAAGIEEEHVDSEVLLNEHLRAQPSAAWSTSDDNADMRLDHYQATYSADEEAYAADPNEVANHDYLAASAEFNESVEQDSSHAADGESFYHRNSQPYSPDQAYSGLSQSEAHSTWDADDERALHLVADDSEEGRYDPPTASYTPIARRSESLGDVPFKEDTVRSSEASTNYSEEQALNEQATGWSQSWRSVHSLSDLPSANEPAAESNDAVRSLPAWFTEDNSLSESQDAKPVEYRDDIVNEVGIDDEGMETRLDSAVYSPIRDSEHHFLSEARTTPADLVIDDESDSDAADSSSLARLDTHRDDTPTNLHQTVGEQVEDVTRDEYAAEAESLTHKSSDDVEPRPSQARVSEPLATGASHQAEEDEEESVEEYMQRLLARVKGESMSTPPSLPPRVVPASKTAEAKTEESRPRPSTIARAVTKSEMPETATLSEEDYTPRSAVPENAVNLEAMRQLANETARSAIAKSNKVKVDTPAKQSNIGKLGISAFGFLVGTCILLINGINMNVAFLGMVCGYLIFLIWGFEATQNIGLTSKRT